MIPNIFVGLVAALHIYFLVLEMFFWTKPIGLKVFRNSPEKAKATAVLAKNQGLYNGFLAAGLIFGLFHSESEIGYRFKLFFLSCVIVAGVYGAMTVSKKIFLVQAAPAIIAGALLFIF